MQGRIDSIGTVKLTWNIQEDKLTSPDGTQQVLPCEECGQPQWISLNVVSTICDSCYEEAVSEEYNHSLDSHDQLGSALTPVIAIFTAFTVAVVLLTQSGLLRFVLARLAEIQ